MRRQSYTGKKTLMGVRNSLLILLAGIVLGALGKWSDYHWMFLADLTSGVQLWVLLGCVIATWSQSCWRAGLNVFLLLGGMVASYYCTAELMDVPWSWPFLIGWSAAAVLSAGAGFLVWFGRGRSKQAWLICLGVLVLQVAAMFVLSGGVRVLDVVLIALTACVLLWDKVVAKRRVS